jgi:hypothetical protein
MEASERDRAEGYELDQLPHHFNNGDQAGRQANGNVRNQTLPMVRNILQSYPMRANGSIAQNIFRYMHLERALERPQLSGMDI